MTLALIRTFGGGDPKYVPFVAGWFPYDALLFPYDFHFSLIAFTFLTLLLPHFFPYDFPYIFPSYCPMISILCPESRLCPYSFCFFPIFSLFFRNHFPSVSHSLLFRYFCCSMPPLIADYFPIFPYYFSMISVLFPKYSCIKHQKACHIKCQTECQMTMSKYMSDRMSHESQIQMIK